jgi:uncharacterized protein (DUF1786 family)
LDHYLLELASGQLTHEEVFKDHGHGALVRHERPLDLSIDGYQVAVTGPRRAMMEKSKLRTHMVVPYGDMMIAGCFGLLRATADLIPDLASPIMQALNGEQPQQAPWDVV